MLIKTAYDSYFSGILEVPLDTFVAMLIKTAYDSYYRKYFSY